MATSFAQGRPNNFPTKLYNENVKLAGKLCKMNINVLFGPVYDLGDDLYQYSPDPDITATLAETTRRAWEIGGKLIAVPKHYPGQKNEGSLTHKRAVFYTEAEYKEGLKPFITTVQNGAKAIMVGHGTYEINGQKFGPATLSKEIISYLRNGLKFTGVIIADEMLQMSAIAGSVEDRYIGALAAGNDMVIMFTNMPEDELLALLTKAVEEAISQKTISVDGLNRSVERILNMKKNYFSYAKTFKLRSISEIIQKMTLTEKIAQTLVLSYNERGAGRTPVGMYMLQPRDGDPKWISGQKQLWSTKDVIPTFIASDQRKSFTVESKNVLVHPRKIGEYYEKLREHK